jgi:hypothetical protein
MAAERTMGTKLYHVDGATETAIADLTSIGEFGLESEEFDVTTLDSPDNYREIIMTIKDAGEISLAGFIKSETNMEDMLDFAEAQTLEEFKVETVSGSTYEFEAFVKMWKEGEASVGGARGFSGSLRISGPVTYTAATPSV